MTPRTAVTGLLGRAVTLGYPLYIRPFSGQRSMADFHGKELYYFSQDAKLMTTPIVVRDALQPGSPAVLFQTRTAGGGAENGQGRQYGVAPDGRFLINSDLDTVASPITLS